MYLEISGRRTGKTTRLIKAVKKELDKGRRVIICSFSHSFLHITYRDLNSPNLIKTTNIYQAIHNYNKKYTTSLRVDDFSIFYDEFDFCGDIVISDSGYYVTTPKKLRKPEDITEEDQLIELLILNNGEYKCYSFINSIARIKELDFFKRTSSKEMFETEFGDKVLKG